MSDSTVLAAIVTGIASIIVALIAVLLARRKKPSDDGGSISNTKVTAGRDAFVVARDLHIQQTQERFISRTGGQVIIDVSKEVIEDEALRQKWSSFDARFLSDCVKDSPRGQAFDGVAFQAYKTPQNDALFSLGVKVYGACCKRIDDESNSDYVAFNKLAQIYLSARAALRQS